MSEGGLKQHAFTALRRGEDGASALFARAIAQSPNDAELIAGHAEALFAEGDPEPWRELDAVLARYPGWLDGHKLAAGLRWECGAGAAFAEAIRAALAARPGDAALWNAYIGLLASVDDQRGAADAAREAQDHFDAPVLRLIEASHAGQAGDLVRADRLLAALPPDLPDRVPVDVRQHLRRGRVRDAAALLDRWRAEKPTDLSSWALTDLVWRLLGDSRGDWLGGQKGLIAAVDLPVDALELERLAATLRGLHRDRARPLGQSVRGGSQTRGPLFERAEPEIALLRERIQATLNGYVDALPPHDDAHPLLRHRERRLRVQGGWSVRLTGAGFHVAHLHPAGAVSSACYITVPQLDKTRQEGWLELGAAPADLALDLSPRAAIQPEPGRLVLFPSFLYHGTRPFGSGERMSVAFDAA